MLPWVMAISFTPPQGLPHPHQAAEWLSQLTNFTATAAARTLLLQQLGRQGDPVKLAAAWAPAVADHPLACLTRVACRGAAPPEFLTLWRQALLQAGASPWRGRGQAPGAFRCWLHGKGRLEAGKNGWTSCDLDAATAPWLSWGQVLAEEARPDVPALLSLDDWHDVLRLPTASGLVKALTQRHALPWAHPAQDLLREVLLDLATLRRPLTALSEAAIEAPPPPTWQGEALLTWLGETFSPGTNPHSVSSAWAVDFFEEWVQQWEAWTRLGHWREQGVPVEARRAVRRAFSAHAPEALKPLSVRWREHGLVLDFLS